MTGAVLVLLLAASPGTPAKGAPSPGELSEDDARVKRFAGALIGGIVGASFPLALAPVFQCPAGGFTPGNCMAPGHYAMAISAPLLGLVGSVSGYVAAGGAPSLAGLGAVLPAALATLGTMALLSQLGVSPVGLWVPAVIVGVSVLAFSSAMLLTAREDALAQAPPRTAREAEDARVRVAMTMVTSTAVGLAGFVAFGACSVGLGCSLPVFITMTAAIAAAQVYGAWGVHRALGGKSPAWAPLLALAIESIGLGLVAIAAWLPSSSPSAFAETARNNLAMTVAVMGSAVGLVTVPALTYEGLHTRAASVPLHVGAAPLPGGALLSLGVAW